jgi:PhnB protein
MRVNPHLHFKGNCAEALRSYATTLGGTVTFSMTYGESPAATQMPKEMAGQIIHSRLEIGGQVLMGMDSPPDRYSTPQGFNVAVEIADPDEAGRVFRALAEGGTVTMPFQQTFWAHRFGMCTDRFGIPWMINCEKAPA